MIFSYPYPPIFHCKSCKNCKMKILSYSHKGYRRKIFTMGIENFYSLYSKVSKAVNFGQKVINIRAFFSSFISCLSIFYYFNQCPNFPLFLPKKIPPITSDLAKKPPHARAKEKRCEPTPIKEKYPKKHL